MHVGNRKLEKQCIIVSFVCMNTKISALVSAIDLKLGMQVPKYLVHYMYNSNFEGHAHCLRKSLYKSLLSFI